MQQSYISIRKVRNGYVVEPIVSSGTGRFAAVSDNDISVYSDIDLLRKDLHNVLDPVDKLLKAVRNNSEKRP